MKCFFAALVDRYGFRVFVKMAIADHELLRDFLSERIDLQGTVKNLKSFLPVSCFPQVFTESRDNTQVSIPQTLAVRSRPGLIFIKGQKMASIDIHSHFGDRDRLV